MVSHKDGSLLMEAILDYTGWLKETQGVLQAPFCAISGS